MPLTITGANNWVTGFEVPVDGEPVVGANMEVAGQALADRSQFVYERIINAFDGIHVGDIEADGNVMIIGSVQMSDVLTLMADLISTGTLKADGFEFRTTQTVYRSSWQYLASSTGEGTVFTAGRVEEARIGWGTYDDLEKPSLYFRSRTAADPSGDAIYSKIELLDTVPGRTLTNVEIVSEGGGTFTGSDSRATYQIGRWSAANIWVALSAEVTDAHAADGSDWTDEVITTVPTTASPTIDPAFRYGVKIKHARAAGSFTFLCAGFKARYDGKSIGG
jgi:hypothetical protein